MNKISNVLWGIVLVLLGVIFGLNSMGITNINVFFNGWWTLFIIVPCFISLFKNNNKTGDIIGIVIGLFLLLNSQGIITFDFIWKLMFPLILIIIGLSFIFKDIFSSKIKEEVKKLNTKSLKGYAATFGGQTIDLTKEKFNGCSLDAVFGAIKCDLTDAIIKEDSIINTSAIFGGITILVPKNINVKITSTPIFGGVSNERKTKNIDGQKTVYINALCMFGGIEIK